MEGDMTVESEYGKGTKFSFSIKILENNPSSEIFLGIQMGLESNFKFISTLNSQHNSS